MIAPCRRAESGPQTAAAAPLPWSLVVFVVSAATVLALVWLESLVALAFTLMDGLAAFAVLAAAGASGLWIVRLLGIGAGSDVAPGGQSGNSSPEPAVASPRGGEAELPARIILGAALGIGTLSLLVLALGSAGVLNRAAAFVLVAALAASGVAAVVVELRSCAAAARSRSRDSEAPAVSAGAACGPGTIGWLWLLVCPSLAIMLLAATLPPGVLWREEGFGYDVLEYHLAVPKTFHEQGRITFLPHNVYSNFPMNSEMLSLLMMTLHGKPIQASLMATMANVALAGLFVAAAWLVGSCFGRRCGTAAAILAATTPWLAYLAGIAYVEAGMLAMGMAALAAALRAAGCGGGSAQDSSRSGRWMLAAGLLAGLACGFKYTALPLLSLPLFVFTLVACPWSLKPLRGILIFLLGALAALAPWLLRNAVNTHNPVFPLAYSVFGAKAGTWDAELETRWQRAHAPTEDEQRQDAFWRQAVYRTVLEPRMGVLLFGLAALGALLRRDRLTLALLAMLAVQAVVWLFTTHLFARFAVVLLLPLVGLAARAVEAAESNGASRYKRALRGGIVGGVMAAAGLNLYCITALYYAHTRPGGIRLDVHARIDAFLGGYWPGTQHIPAINGLGGDKKVLLVGDARSFYILAPADYATVFNRLPLADAVQRDSSSEAVLAWVRENGYTHLFVNWSEMERLAGTYGFYRGVDWALLRGLIAAGLKEAAAFSAAEGQPPYATLYKVPENE